MTRVENEQQIRPEDYEMVGSIIPVSEFEMSMDMLIMLSTGQGEEAHGTTFAPRNIMQYDLFNIVRTYPPPRINISFLVVDKDNHGHLAYENADGLNGIMDVHKDYQLGMFQLQTPLPSVLREKFIAKDGPM